MPAYDSGFYGHLLPPDRLKDKTVVITHVKWHLTTDATSAFAHVYESTISMHFFLPRTYKR
jgi:hypothetical protein